jgi:pimeloyl-ACP methyl ester carboxylesterase
MKLQCSFFEPDPAERPCKEMPCVIYLHGNSSSRVEGINMAYLLLPAHINLFCFDFSGSGRSDGEFISLGWWEREDVLTVVEHLRKSGTVSTIGLWGRSMGAATALLHADRDPSIAALVLDSPFSSMSKLADELYRKHAPDVPGFVFSMLQYFVKKSIRSRAQFNLDDLTPIAHVGQAFIPALFIVAKGDEFILPSHGISLYEKYAGEKNLIQVDGDHSSIRPDHALLTIYMFLTSSLQVDQLVPGAKKGEIPNISKLPRAIHYVPPQPAISIGPMNVEDIEDQELKAALKLSMETYEMEKHRYSP